jgi:hypothetical protein
MLVRALLVAMVALLLVGADPAGAVVRFAEPDGNGANPCAQADPCEIENAIENVAADGDEVALLPGTYPIEAAQLVVSDDITLRAANPAQPPMISGTGMTLMLVGGAATIRDVAFEQIRPAFDASSTLFVLNEAALVERVSVHAVNGGVACNIARGTMRDSTCWSEGGSAGIGSSVGSPGTYESKFVNVTGWGDSAGGMTVFAASDGVDLTVTAKNSIAPSVLVATDGSANASATATLENSNFQASNTINDNTSVTNPGEGTNQVTPALLAHSDSPGDFHQLVGSPTINAGLPDPLLGTLDIDLEDRVMGAAVDIGADEFTVEEPPPADTDPPQTTITDQPKAKVKLKKGKKKAPYSFSFTADEPSTFRCQLDDRPEMSCTSPFAGKVKKGTHTFSVFAVDTAGNEDATPATATWKVKKRKKKRR